MTTQTLSNEMPLPANPRGIAVSGKRMTVILLAILLVSGGLFYWVTTAYATYNAARRQTDQAWREVASLLESRYRGLDKLVASGVDAQQIDMRLGEQWQFTRQAFAGTALTAHQVESANQLEQLVAQLPATVQESAKPADGLSQAAGQYTQAMTNQTQVGNSAGSQLLKSMLILPDPLEFKLFVK